MSRPLLIDYFCGEGGAAAGYVRAGFRVWGIDSNPRLRDRYLESGAERFICADANEWEPDDEPAACHWSPPCHDHSDLATTTGKDHGTAWMLPHAISRARAGGAPFVIENVEGAEQYMDGAVMLCGSMFGLSAVDGGKLRYLRRHRLFLTSFPMLVPPDQCRGKAIGGVYGTGGGGQMTRGWKFRPGPARPRSPWACRGLPGGASRRRSRPRTPSFSATA